MKCLVLVFTLILSSCSNNTSDQILSSGAQAKLEIPTTTNLVDPKKCNSNGGVIKNICMAQTSFCVKEFFDAGKTCNDSSECTGECRVKNQFVKAGTIVTGVCSSNNIPCGCYQSIMKGVAEHALCRD